jgi:hypothetical protein
MKKTEKDAIEKFWVGNIQQKVSDELIEYLSDRDLSVGQFAELYGKPKEYVMEIIRRRSDLPIDEMLRLMLFIERAPVIEFKPIMAPENIQPIDRVPTLVKATNKPFADWALDGNLPLNTRIVRAVSFRNFTERHPEQKGAITPKRFAQLIGRYAEVMGFTNVDRKTSSCRYTVLS